MTDRYTVKPGDTLWRIAESQLGSGRQWPRIWRYNNRASVARLTGSRIPDPDVIFPGQVLFMPVTPATTVGPGVPSSPPGAPAVAAVPARPAPSPPASTSPGRGAPADAKPLGRQLPHVSSPISIKYRLDDLKFPPLVQPGCIMEMRMTGDVLLMSKKSYPALYVTQRREIEAQVVSQANGQFHSLFSDTRLVYDSQKHSMTYRSMLVSQSNVPSAPATAIGVQFDSNNPVPKLRFEFRFPKLVGVLPLFRYTALDVKLVVELTPLPPKPPGPTAQPVRAPRPSPQAVPQSSYNWDKIIGVGLLATAGAVVVGTLVEDFFTVGAGMADDPASFAGAAAAVGRGLQMLRGASAMVLPAASVPAVVSVSVGLQSAHPQAAPAR